jgi:hypothetical protein
MQQMSNWPRSIWLVLGIATVGCSPCVVEIPSQVDSPDGSITATWWTVNYGATTDYISQVSIHPKSGRFRKDS